MSAEAFKAFRTKVCDAILATDMVHHFQMVDTLKVRVSQAEQDRPFAEGTDLDPKDRDPADQKLLLEAMMHMSDIGNCCRPFSVHKYLVAKLEEEFFNQGDRERELGLPVSPMSDRLKDSAAAGQGFFIGKLVMPLATPVTFLFNDSRRKRVIHNLEDNVKNWEGMVAKHGKTIPARRMLELEGFLADRESFSRES